MKLKYYLRGLGIGIVITTLILMIAYRLQNKMSDEEIIKKAEALGMVMAETEDPLFPNHPTNQDESNSIEETTPTKESESSKETASEQITEPSSEQQVTTAKEEETTKQPETTTVKEEPTTKEPASTTANANVKTYTLTIKGGMYSESVSELLAQNGIVPDANAFNDYLCNNGYEVNIQTGTYTVTSDMSFEQLAKKITGR